LLELVKPPAQLAKSKVRDKIIPKCKFLIVFLFDVEKLVAQAGISVSPLVLKNLEGELDSPEEETDVLHYFFTWTLKIESFLSSGTTLSWSFWIFSAEA